MLVGTNHGAIHKVDLPVNLPQDIAVLLQGLQDTQPVARITPTVETAGDSPDFAIAFGQVAPGCSGTQDPEHAVDEWAVVFGRSTRAFTFW